jgi:hypothetical protein
VYDEGWITGELLAHGKAPYRHDPNEKQSYFIRLRMLETEAGAARERARIDQAERRMDGQTSRLAPSIHNGGEVKRWGNDLERAIKQSRSHVQIGQIVAVKIVAREPITPTTPSAQRTRDEPRYWNRWEVETVQYVAQRNRFAHAVNENRRNARHDGIAGKEALALYLIHEGAERLAAVRYPNAKDRKEFVDRVRNFLAVSPEREQIIARAAARISAGKLGPKAHSGPQHEPPVRE